MSFHLLGKKPRLGDFSFLDAVRIAEGEMWGSVGGDMGLGRKGRRGFGRRDALSHRPF